MHIGVAIAGDPWRFFNDIYQDLQQHHQVSVFERRQWNAPLFHTRINRYMFHRDLESFLGGCEVVFFEWASELLARATQLPKRTPIITRLHRYELFQWAHKINWDNVDKIILVSRAMQAKFHAMFPDQATKTVVIPVGVDLTKFQHIYRPFGGEIGTLCFLSPRKRVYELILAYAELDRLHPGLRLRIGGSGNKFGDYNEALHRLVGKLNLQDRVRFDGDVPEPWKWMPSIDIFVSNSYSEGLQVASMEALACGRFSLSHHWDGAEELLPPDQLFLTDSQFHAKVLDYVDCPETKKRRRQEEMRHLAEERFNQARISEQVRAVIEEVAASREGRA